MPQKYKQWIIAVLCTLVLGMVVFTFMDSTKGPTETETQGYTPPSIPQTLVEFSAKEKQLLDTLSKDPENPRIIAALGDLYFENDRFEQAIKEYNKVLKLNPSDVDTYNDLGLAEFYTGRTNSAVDTLKKGTAVDPSFQRIWLSLGFVLASSGRNEEAREILNKAVELDPNSNVGQEAKRILGLI
jgi:Flp pilus assembly protein TadD